MTAVGLESSASSARVEAGDVSGWHPDAAGDRPGIVDLNEDEGSGPGGGGGVEVLDTVVRPPQPHAHRDRFAAGETLRHGPGVEDPLMASPPLRHVPVRHHPLIIQVFERDTGVFRLWVTLDACGRGSFAGVCARIMFSSAW